MNPTVQLAQASAILSGGLSVPAPGEWRKFYSYPIQIAAIAANGGTASANLQFQNDAPFFILQICAEVFTNAAPPVFVANPDVQFQMIDTGSNFPLSSVPVNLDLISGNGQMPFVLPIPYMMQRNSTMLFNLINNTASVNNVYISLHGFKALQTQGS